MLLCFEHESAGLAEAQPATLGTVLVLASESEVEQHKLTHTNRFEAGVDTAYVPRAKRAHNVSRVQAARRGQSLSQLAGFDGLAKAVFVQQV